MPLVFTRDTFVAGQKPSRVDGIWLGTSQFQGQAVRTQIVVKSDSKGQEFCAVDSPDLNVFDIPCTNVTYSEDDFSFDAPFAQGRWSGKLSSDGKRLTGTWTQTSGAAPPAPLNLERQTQKVLPVPPAPLTYDSPMDPVSAESMESVLRRDLQKTFGNGLLEASKPTGIAIGVLRAGESRVFTLGTAKTDSLFEIGSVTKTFTGLVLAQMIEQGKVREETPVRELLPKDTVAKPPGAEITLLDLVTQHSGCRACRTTSVLPIPTTRMRTIEPRISISSLASMAFRDPIDRRSRIAILALGFSDKRWQIALARAIRTYYSAWC